MKVLRRWRARADKVNAVTVPAAPAGPHNTWECKKAAGTKSDVYMESPWESATRLLLAIANAELATSSQSPVARRRAEVPGTVLSGGADFQILENGTFKEIDARYSVRSEEGEIVIVRNCGPLGGLVPVFETAKDGQVRMAQREQMAQLRSWPWLSVLLISLSMKVASSRDTERDYIEVGSSLIAAVIFVEATHAVGQPPAHLMRTLICICALDSVPRHRRTITIPRTNRRAVFASRPTRYLCRVVSKTASVSGTCAVECSLALV